MVLEHELCVEFSLTYVAIRLTFLVVLSKVSLESFCIAENFATIKAGSLPSGVHRLTVCSALKNGHILCRIEHFHFLDGMLTSVVHFLLNTLYHFITFLDSVPGGGQPVDVDI